MDSSKAARWAACGVLCLGVVYAFQRPFRQFPDTLGGVKKVLAKHYRSLKKRGRTSANTMSAMSNIRNNNRSK